MIIPGELNKYMPKAVMPPRPQAVLPRVPMTPQPPSVIQPIQMQSWVPTVNRYKSAISAMQVRKQADMANQKALASMQATRTPDSTSTAGMYTNKKSGNYGPSAYGYKGTTGLAKNKGSAPMGAQPQFWQALQTAMKDMNNELGSSFKIGGIFRSYEAQVSTKKKKGKLAATPGRSVHGLGLAADLELNGKQLAWLKRNGKKYGLVNLPSESWHWQLDPNVWKG